MSDPYSYSFDDNQAWFRSQFYVSCAISHPNCNMIFPDDDEIAKLPGDLPRLARSMDRARTREEALAAGNAFLVASEEYVDRVEPEA